jgi:hypothetical protein
MEAYAMPNIFLLPNEDVGYLMTKGIFKKISRAIRKAVADTLQLEVSQVTTYRLHVDDVDGDEVCGLQILCLASHSKERFNNLVILRNNIAAAMQKLYSEDEACRKILDIAGAESWPIMPFGSWMKIDFGDQNVPNE